MRGFLLALGCFSFLATAAQNITIKKVELAGEKIIVHYDLEDGNPNNEYKLDLFSSADNFVSPLTKVSGDVGDEIKPGTGRKIEWNVREELGGYKGRLSLEIRGKVYVPFIRLQNFDAAKSYKRGKSYSLAWKPGNTNPINIELYKGGQRISGEMNQPNNGGHTFYVPAQAKKGNDYRIKITDTKSSEDILFTSDFKVKPKVPLALKVLPIVALGGAAAVLLGGGGGDPETSTGGDDSIPLPALPGGN
ncbi:MAG: hypothetical protein U5K54_10915 [Cytophagales bacterium]|nr:hypothetical protein [Cytophagales bacterium]